MSKKSLSVLFAALAASALLVSAASAAVTIKVGHVLNTDHSWHKNLAGFAEEVGKATEGRVAIQVYPSGQLGNEKDMVEGLTLGIIDAGLIGGGSFQSIDAKFGIEALPYAWPTHEAAYNAFDGKIGELLFKLLDSKGIVGLAWWENGFRHITNNVKPVAVPEDIKGLKLRVTPDKMRLDTFEQLGAAPVAINFGELYSSLQQGVVDGQENPYAIIYSNAFYEVQLSAADQKTVADLAHKWGENQRKETIAEEENFLKLLAEKGMQINEVDKAAFQKAVQPVWEKYESVFGKELMDLVHEYGK